MIPLPLTREGYETFLRCKKLPTYQVVRDEGDGFGAPSAHVETDEQSWALVFGQGRELDRARAMLEGVTTAHLLDFQRLLVERAIERQRFAVFADCGLGKTPMGLAWAHAVAKTGRVLVLSPLAVVEQWQRECERWHGHRMANLRRNEQPADINIINFEARRALDVSGYAGIVLDEASILKNADGETRDYLCELASGIPYRLALSATPAPNDQAEYASQAVFLGLVKTAKEFWSRFFRKDGTKNIMRGHAVEPFYRYLSSWATYIQSPRALGFEATTELCEQPSYEEVHVPVHAGWTVPKGKKIETLDLSPGADRARNRPAVLGPLRWEPGSPRMAAIEAFAKEPGPHGVLAWALRNKEEAAIAETLSGSGRVAVVNGKMSIEARVEALDAYRSGEVRHLVSKPKVLGFGVNLPECDRMAYSGYDYSFESFYQAVRRAHRFGRVGRLRVLLPVTPPELPILDALHAKMKTFERDVLELQARFWKAEGT
jgi:hypothetical protein